jgi:hypothetical protein
MKIQSNMVKSCELRLFIFDIPYVFNTLQLSNWEVVEKNTHLNYKFFQVIQLSMM